MHSVRLRQSLAVAVTLSLTMLMGGGVGLGLAIQNGVVVPPLLDVGIADIRIAAYRTHDPICPPYTYCPLESGVPPRAFYVVWRVDERATAAQPDGRTAHRLLVVPLQR
jgi:hypothetical protein